MANLSDLIAQSISDNPQKLVNLALATQMMGSGSGLGGTNYVFVKGDGTPEENAVELQEAYDKAKTMPRYLGSSLLSPSNPSMYYKGQTFYYSDGGTPAYYMFTESTAVPTPVPGVAKAVISELEAKSTRTTVVVAPGQYKFGTSGFIVDTSYISIVSLTGDADVFIDSSNETVALSLYSESGLYSVYLKGLNCKNKTISFPYGVYESTFENCVGGQASFGGSVTVGDSNTFINCIGGDYSFCGEYDGTANAKYINCTGGNYSFGGADGAASGTFSNCTGGNNSFGGGEGGSASGTFSYCTGGYASFGGRGTASGTFTGCTGGDYSFGGDGGEASGTFNNCIGVDNSFGGMGTASGTFINCTGGNRSFGGRDTASGTFTGCTGGDYSFGGNGGSASGTFNNCIGVDNSFGGKGTASGTFTGCIGGGYSFGGAGSITGDAKLYFCKLTVGVFTDPDAGGKLVLCIDGNDAVVTTP